MLSERHLKGIKERGLNPDLAVDMGLYSAHRSRDSSGNLEFIADIEGEVLCLPFREHGEEVNCKYRWAQDGDRRFMQKKGAVKTVYNADVLFDRDLMIHLESGDAELIWTEGEFDCIAS